MQVTITRYGPDIDEFTKEIEFKFIKVKEGLRELGQEAREKMLSIIDASRRFSPTTASRLTAGVEEWATGKQKYHLKDVIKVEDTPDGVGVGNIYELDAKTPYWHILDVGGSQRIPKEGDYMYPVNVSRLKFIGRDGDIVYRSRVKARTNVITGRKYVDATHNWLKTVWQIRFYSMLKETKINVTGPLMMIK